MLFPWLGKLLPTQVWLTGHLLFLPPHLRVHPITFYPVFAVCFSTAHILSQNCHANLLYYVVGVSLPVEGKLQTMSFLVLLYCAVPGT